jgi:hypothetical protein
MVIILLRSSRNEPLLGNEETRNNRGAIGVGVFYTVSAGRLYIEMMKQRSFRTFINIYSLFKSESLSSQIKLTLHEALIRSVTTYVHPAWLLAAYISISSNCSACKTRFYASLEIFQGARRSAICT